MRFLLVVINYRRARPDPFGHRVSSGGARVTDVTFGETGRIEELSAFFAASSTLSRRPRRRAATARPAGVMPHRPLANRPRRSRPLFRLFYQVEIRYRQFLQ
jgi:hypothetical protein